MPSTVVLTFASRAGDRLDAISAAAIPHRVLLHRDAVRTRHHFHRQLHVPELPRPLSSVFFCLTTASLKWILPQRIRGLIEASSRPLRRTAAVCLAKRSTLEFAKPNCDGISLLGHDDFRRLPLGWSSTSPRLSSSGCSSPRFPFLQKPRCEWLEPFRIANGYGLFASMTHARLRNRIPRLRRRQDVDSVSLPLQAAGSRESARASTRPTSRASSGTYGSHRSAIWQEYDSSCGRRSACCRSSRTCSRSSRAIRFRLLRRSKFAR